MASPQFCLFIPMHRDKSWFFGKISLVKNLAQQKRLGPTQEKICTMHRMPTASSLHKQNMIIASTMMFPLVNLATARTSHYHPGSIAIAYREISTRQSSMTIFLSIPTHLCCRLFHANNELLSSILPDGVWVGFNKPQVTLPHTITSPFDKFGTTP